MLTATLDARVSHAQRDLGRALNYLALPHWLWRVLGFAMSALVARRLSRFTGIIARDVLELLELTRMVEAVDPQGADQIDGGGHLSAHFAAMRGRIAEVQRRALALAALADPHDGLLRIALAAHQLAGVCAEYRETLSALSWAVLEHDAARAPRLAGYTADTPEAVAAMLERIAAGE